jgi:hypothetical protein
MGFVCYVFDHGFPPPVLAPLAAQCVDAALAEARGLLVEREQAHSVELWSPEGRLAVIHRDPGDPTEGDQPL